MTELLNEKWNAGGAVTEAEKNDHNMTAQERYGASLRLASILAMVKRIQYFLNHGAPCAYEKTMNDIESVDQYLSLIWERVEDYNPNATED